MKKLILAVVLAAQFIAPAWAKNFAFPAQNPAATVTIPDSWTTNEIDYGFSAKSPDDSVFFSIESTDAKGVDKMMALNTSWMKDNNIKPKGKPLEQEFDLGGLKASMVRHKADDDDGETIVDFVFVAAGDRLIMFTLWASDEERTKNAADIKTIQSTIKAIN